MRDTEHVKGLSDLDRKMTQLPLRVRKNQLRAAIRAGAAVIGREARRIAAVQWPNASRLKRAGGIVWRVGRIRGNTVRSKVSWTTDRSRPADQTSAPWYGHFLEFGTSKLAARPFLRPAFMTKQAEALDAFRKRLSDGIDKELRKLR